MATQYKNRNIFKQPEPLFQTKSFHRNGPHTTKTTQLVRFAEQNGNQN